jgi:urease accessory protein
MTLSPGDGICEVARRGGGSAVVRLVTRSPLRLLTPRNHGRAAWIVAGSYGGGLVDGDALRLSLRVAAGAAAYVATQSSTKVYPGAASQRFDADVGEDALLVSLPDPIVCFAGARYRQDATIRLAPGAELVWLEGLTAGRAARGERWLFDGYRSHTRIERGGATLVLDGLVLDPEHGPLARRLGRFGALATLLVVGPLRAHLLDAASAIRRGAGALVAPSPIGEDAAVCRVAAVSAETLARALRPLLAPVATALGDDPFARKGALAWEAGMARTVDVENV